MCPAALQQPRSCCTSWAWILQVPVNYWTACKTSHAPMGSAASGKLPRTYRTSCTQQECKWSLAKENQWLKSISIRWSSHPWFGQAVLSLEKGRRARAIPIYCKTLTFAETLTVCGIAVCEYLAFSHSQSLEMKQICTLWCVWTRNWKCLLSKPWQVLTICLHLLVVLSVIFWLPALECRFLSTHAQSSC